MMTLLTGVPGSGKTLYAIDKLLRPMVGATVKHENEDGQIVDVPREIFTNINGLLLEHQKIGNDQINNWHTWAKPGALIVFDEVQKPWPLMATGSKAPDCITALETHRHMGVDFIVITQHPMLIHANVVRLIGRHLHVRRMGNMGLAVVYEWDSCSKTLLYKNSLSKAPYRYNKKVFDLYKSAELHTKQPRRIPTLVFGALGALAALLFLSPSTVARIQDRINPPPAVAKAEPVKPKSPAAAEAKALLPALPHTPAEISQPEPAQAAGCVASPKRCTCYDTQGWIVHVPEQICRAGSVTYGMLVKTSQATPSTP